MDVTGVLQRLDEAIDDLAALDATDLSAHERSHLLHGVNTQLRRLDHQRHVRTGELERSGMLLDLGYRTIAQWQRDQLRCPDHTAGRVGARSRDLVHLPTVAEDWAEAEQRLGRKPKSSELRRTNAHCRADAPTTPATAPSTTSTPTAGAVRPPPPTGVAPATPATGPAPDDSSTATPTHPEIRRGDEWPAVTNHHFQPSAR